jgi:hypothetical protein
MIKPFREGLGIKGSEGFVKNEQSGFGWLGYIWIDAYDVVKSGW